ncbi:MAG: STAS/SEC14 domain-containing protein [Flavobacteriales bacterium]|nr:STAS/SEC14 domain-containing protein [Flavobacteriales bacterium]
MLTGESPGPAHHHVQHNDNSRPLWYCPMSTTGQHIETPTATIVLVAEKSVEQRYKAEARFVPGAVEQNRKARWKLTRGAPHTVLIILPAELPVHPPAMNEDHFRLDSEERRIIALAVVAPTAALNAATKFYFRYYAQAFEARVFEAEEEARAWLSAQLRSTGPA